MRGLRVEDLTDRWQPVPPTASADSCLAFAFSIGTALRGTDTELWYWKSTKWCILRKFDFFPLPTDDGWYLPVSRFLRVPQASGAAEESWKIFQNSTQIRRRRLRSTEDCGRERLLYNFPMSKRYRKDTVSYQLTLESALSIILWQGRGTLSIQLQVH